MFALLNSPSQYHPYWFFPLKRNVKRLNISSFNKRDKMIRKTKRNITIENFVMLYHFYNVNNNVIDLLCSLFSLKWNWTSKIDKIHLQKSMCESFEFQIPLLLLDCCSFLLFVLRQRHIDIIIIVIWLDDNGCDQNEPGGFKLKNFCVIELPLTKPLI